MKTNLPDKNKLKEIFNKFNVDGNFKDVKKFGNGLINKTYIVETDVKDYMLQVINSYAFRNIDDLMRNIYIVTNHLRNEEKTTIHVRKTFNHKIYILEDGLYYRLYTYIKDSNCYEKLESLDLVYKAGQAFGDFHNSLADLDSILIAETIPGFHNTQKRYQDLLDAMKVDEVGRVEAAMPLFNTIAKYKKYFSAIVDGLNNGTIPERIVHNDPKINNILFDKTTGEFKCVIDLDTIMPGSYLYDFGDALRSLFTGENESNPDTSVMKADMNIFRAYASGYLSKMKDSLTANEILLMPLSVFILTIELAIRFLEDYIRGDLYFKTSFDGENLVRAKGQIALALDILEHKEEMTQIIKEIIGE